jgi:hypothetical protein
MDENESLLIAQNATVGFSRPNWMVTATYYAGRLVYRHCGIIRLRLCQLGDGTFHLGCFMAEGPNCRCVCSTFVCRNRCLRPNRLWSVLQTYRARQVWAIIICRWSAGASRVFNNKVMSGSSRLKSTCMPNIKRMNRSELERLRTNPSSSNHVSCR